MIEKTVRKNLQSTLLIQLSEYLLPLLLFPYLSRTLGVSGFGTMAFALALSAYLTLLPNWGFAISALQLTIRQRDQTSLLSQTFWNVLFLKLLLAAITIFLLLIVGITLKLPTIDTSILPSIALIVAGAATNITWFLQGAERMGSLALFSIAGKALSVGLTFLLVKSPVDVPFAVGIPGFCAIISGIASIGYCLHTNIIKPIRPSLALSQKLLTDGVGTFLSTLSIALYTNTNLLILGWIFGNSSTGIFSGADKLRAAGQSLITPFSNAFFPRVSRLMLHEPKQGISFAKRLLLFQGSWTLLLSILLFLTSNIIVRLVLGPGFEKSAYILKWLSLCPFLIGLNNVLGMHMMLPLGMRYEFNRVLMSTAILNLIIVVPLIVALAEVGAAIATLISELYVTVAMYVSLTRHNPTLFQMDRVTNEI